MKSLDKPVTNANKPSGEKVVSNVNKSSDEKDNSSVKESFHIQHGLTVEGVMRYYAKTKGYNEDFWGIVGLLHDIDFEMYSEEHCIKAPELLEKGGVKEDMIHAIVSHAYGLGVDVEPVHEMEKVLYATDELTGLIWACAIIRQFLR